MFGFCSSFTDRDPECAECKKADEAIEKAKEKWVCYMFKFVKTTTTLFESPKFN